MSERSPVQNGQTTNQSSEEAALAPEPMRGGIVGMVYAMISRGHGAVQIAEVVKANVELKGEIFRLLHQTLGNGFAQQVIELVAPTQHAPAAHPASPAIAHPAAATKPGRVRVTASALRVRSTPNAHASDNVIGTMSQHDTADVVSHDGEWLRISHGGQPAFIHAHFVEPADAAHAAAPSQVHAESASAPAPVPAAHDDVATAAPQAPASAATAPVVAPAPAAPIVAPVPAAPVAAAPAPIVAPSPAAPVAAAPAPIVAPAPIAPAPAPAPAMFGPVEEPRTNKAEATAEVSAEAKAAQEVNEVVPAAESSHAAAGGAAAESELAHAPPEHVEEKHAEAAAAEEKHAEAAQTEHKADTVKPHEASDHEPTEGKHEKIKTKPKAMVAAGREIFSKGGRLAKDKLRQFSLTGKEYDFKQRVYDAATARLGDHVFGGVKPEDLAPCDGGKQIRKDVAPHLDALLGAMRTDIAAGIPVKGPDGDVQVGDVTDIKVVSGYRSPEHDMELWDSYFQNYFAETTAARAATGDPFGKQAVQIMVHHIGPKKAPPGGSNHSNGNGTDLQVHTKHGAIPNHYGDQKAWRKSWAYFWLQHNAKRFGFSNYPAEAWHWEWWA